MDFEEKAKQYLVEVQSWLQNIRNFLDEQEMEVDPNMLVEIDRVYHDVKHQLQEENISEPVVSELQRTVRQMNHRVVQLFERNQIRIRESVPIGKHVLPPLPYAYNALEPYISEEIMRLHHTKHHQSYVDGLNTAEEKLREARRRNQFDLIKHWEREAAFHGSGHYLHTIFWEIMNPRGGGKPKGELLAQIEKDFGSYELFKKHFSEAAKKVEGVGWAILVWSPRSRRLEILQAERHQFLTQWDTIPLLVLDVWEHAYYLQYKNDRGKYVDQWWNVVYWPNVEKRFAEAKKLKWQPY
ncbi:superoxide dismutase [Bacillus smithii]|uniref:superoxide dismutase n=1 Tax=Bacillus smithii TaxID=1479 RepID=UPI002E1E1126|nr:superoxide dismutase [Bacillus smithii]